MTSPAPVSPALRVAAFAGCALPFGLLGNTLYYWHWPDGLAAIGGDVALFAAALAIGWAVAHVWSRRRPLDRWRRALVAGGATAAIYAGLLFAQPLGPRAHVFAPAGCDFAVAFPGRPDRTEIFAAAGERSVAVGRRAVLGLPGITSSVGAECVTAAGVADDALARGQAEARAQLEAAMRQARFSIRTLTVAAADPRRLDLVAATELRDAENRPLTRVLEMRVHLGRASILRVWYTAVALEAEPSLAPAAPFFAGVTARR